MLFRRRLTPDLARPRLSRLWLCALAGGTCLAGATQALGQIARNPADGILSVLTRTNPAYDPEGIRLGDFIWTGSLDTGLAYTDNVYATDTDQEEDFIYTLSPRVGLASDWNRHAFSLSASAEQGRYQENSGEDYEDYFAGLSARLDIGGQTSVPLGLNYQRDHYQRDFPDDRDGIEPTVFDVWTGTVGAINRGARFAVKTIATVRDYAFQKIEDTFGNEINDTRDRTELNLYSSLGLPEEAFIAPFVYSDITDISYDQKDSSGLDRSAKNYETGAGAIFNFSDVTKASFNIGYINRIYDSGDFDDISDLGYGLNIVWEPSTLAAFTLTGKRATEETIQSGSSAAVRTSLTLGAKYELFPNLFIDPSIGYQHREYEGIDRAIEGIRAGLSMTYKMNRNMWLNGGYQYINQEEKGSDQGADSDDFTSNTYRLTLKFQF